MRGRILCICILNLFVAPGAVRAQQQPDQDPIGQSFFAPELVIQHQEAIGAERRAKRLFQGGNPPSAAEIHGTAMEAAGRNGKAGVAG